MDLQAPYLGNQTQEQLQLRFPGSLITTIAKDYLAGFKPEFNYTLPRVYEILIAKSGVNSITLPFELTSPGIWDLWIKRYSSLVDHSAFQLGPFQVMDRTIRWEIPGLMMDQIVNSLAIAIAGGTPADVQGLITVYYDTSNDLRGNGMDLGSPTKEY